MGKKKVAIDKKELEPQTIKKIKKHNFGFLFVMFAIISFGAVIYFLPTVFSLYESAIKNGTISFGNNTSNTIPENNDAELPEETEPEITYLTLNTDKKVSFSNVTFDDISYENNIITVKILSSTNSTLVLSKYSYFMNVFDENKNKIKTVYFSENVNGSTTKLVTINNAYYYNIVIMEDKDYDYFTLEPDEFEQTFLNCTKGNNTVKYTFSDEKLIAIEDKIVINNPDDSIRDQYKSFQANYEAVSGIVVQITDDDPYIFIVNVDLKLYNGNIKTYYFARDSYAREIKYKLEAMDYTCR